MDVVCLTDRRYPHLYNIKYVQVCFHLFRYILSLIINKCRYPIAVFTPEIRIHLRLQFGSYSLFLLKTMYFPPCATFAENQSAYHLYGKPSNSRENSNGTIDPSRNFPEKRQHLSRYYLFQFSPKQSKFFVPFVWLTSAWLLLEAEGDNGGPFPGGLWSFTNGTSLTHSFFRKRFQVQYYLPEFF